MTRTERNQHPAALLKDRHSRSGLIHQSELARKNGAGAHNWGSYSQENDLEAAARRDADAEAEADEGGNAGAGDGADVEGVFDMEGDEGLGPLPVPKGPKGMEVANGVDGEAGKGKQDDAISTSPTESMSSLDSVGGQGQKGRRMSNVSDEERERARAYREGVMHKGQPDLAHIARTSYGIAQSPPSFSTSPIKAMGALGAFQK